MNPKPPVVEEFRSKRPKIVALVFSCSMILAGILAQFGPEIEQWAASKREPTLPRIISNTVFHSQIERDYSDRSAICVFSGTETLTNGQIVLLRVRYYTNSGGEFIEQRQGQ